MTGITLDTGALIALERRRQRMVNAIIAAVIRGVTVTAPSVVVAEWWRGRSDARQRILDGLFVEHTDDALVKSAGEAVAVVSAAGVVDAIVMASAARRGDVVYTSDFHDLDRLRRYFPSVRILAV
jgi:predicted nucleic acid-binding protein